MSQGSNPALVFGAVIVGAAAGFFSHDLIVGKREPDALPENTGKPDAPDQAATALRTANEALSKEVRALQDELARRPVPAPPKQADPTDSAAVKAGPDGKPIEATFDSDELHAVLGKIDWTKVGTNMKDMVPLLAKLGEAIAKGETPDLDVLAAVQRLNADLVEAAKVISDGDVPGNGINGSFTHPVVVANQFGAALKAAGHTLDAEQQTSLNRIMKVFAAKDQNLRLAEGDRELKLENLAEETELKHQFYAEAKGLLNADQRAALYDSKTEGRAQLDMFDPGLMLGQFARPVPASDAKSFAAAAGSTYKAKLGISGKAGEQLDAVVAEWSRNYPPAYWESKADSLEQNRMMKTDRIRTALNRQLDLTRMIMSKVDLTPAQRKQLAQSQMVLVPLPN